MFCTAVTDAHTQTSLNRATLYVIPIGPACSKYAYLLCQMMEVGAMV